MSKLLCWLGIHLWVMPPHRRPLLWEDHQLECARGCGKRTVWRCHEDEHWAERHPELPR